MGREQRSGRHDEAVGMVERPGLAGKLRHHGLQHRLLAEIWLEQRCTAGAMSVVQRQLAEAGDGGRTAAAENIDGLADKALLAAADVIDRAEAAIGEAKLDGPAFLALTWIAGSEGMHFERNALLEPDGEVDEMAHIAKQHAAAL